MTVNEAYEIIRSLEKVRDLLKANIGSNYSEDFWRTAAKVKKYDFEIRRLSECILNQEMDDSFQPNNELYWINED